MFYILILDLYCILCVMFVIKMCFFLSLFKRSRNCSNAARVGSSERVACIY